MKKPVPPVKFFLLLLLIALLLITSPLVFAHTGDGPHNDWLYGFAHPLSGLDHILAMVAIGLWAAQAHGRIVWLFPLIFVGVMGLGGLLGMIALPLAFAEYGIMLSLLILGALLAWCKHLPLSVNVLADRIICAQPWLCAWQRNAIQYIAALLRGGFYAGDYAIAFMRHRLSPVAKNLPTPGGSALAASSLPVMAVFY